MKATYIGDGEQTEVFGLTFPKGEAVDVSSLTPAQQKKLAGHPAFEADAPKGKAKADA